MTRTLTVLSLLASGVYAQTPIDWRFAHPDADLRASINVQTLLKSPMVATLTKQAPKDSQPQINMVMGMLSTIDRISLSMRQTAPPPGQAKADAPAVSASDSDILVLVNGGFDPTFLQAMLGGGGPTMKQVDPHTVLVGQGPSFDQSLRRLSGPASAGAADELEQSDIWLDGDLTRLSQQQSQPTPPGFENVRRLSLGMRLGENVDFSLILTASDPAAAQALLKTVTGLIAQAGLPAEATQMMAKALDMRQEGAKVRLHFVPPPEMIKAVQEQAASPDSDSSFSALQPLLGILGIGGSSAPKPAQPENDGKIVINGLDDGPRVIPIGK